MNTALLLFVGLLTTAASTPTACSDQPVGPARYNCLEQRQLEVFAGQASAVDVYDEYTTALRELDVAPSGEEAFDPALGTAYFQQGQLALYVVFHQSDEEYVERTVDGFEQAVRLDPTNQVHRSWLLFIEHLLDTYPEATMTELAQHACARPQLDLRGVCGAFYSATSDR